MSDQYQIAAYGHYVTSYHNILMRRDEHVKYFFVITAGFFVGIGFVLSQINTGQKIVSWLSNMEGVLVLLIAGCGVFYSLLFMRQLYVFHCIIEAKIDTLEKFEIENNLRLYSEEQKLFRDKPHALGVNSYLIASGAILSYGVVFYICLAADNAALYQAVLDAISQN